MGEGKPSPIKERYLSMTAPNITSMKATELAKCVCFDHIFELKRRGYTNGDMASLYGLKKDDFLKLKRYFGPFPLFVPSSRRKSFRR